MTKINVKSLIFGIVLGALSWLWAFIIVGFAFFDYSTNQPVENPNLVLYALLLILNFILTIIVLSLYLRTYEKRYPIYAENWLVDAFLLGLIVCGMNFLLDAIFFGAMGRDLLAYFFIESTTGYLYPAIILETVLLAYIYYGRDKQ